MGFNTLVVVMNDSLGCIKNDPNFGKNLHDAICKLNRRDGFRDVAAGHSVNAATAIATCHADQTSVIAFGGNTGLNMGLSHVTNVKNNELMILKDLASQLGYRLVKKD